MTYKPEHIYWAMLAVLVAILVRITVFWPWCG